MHRVSPLIGAGHVHDMHDEGGTLDMAEELVPQALAFACTLDEARHIGNDEGVAIAGTDHAEVRDKRRERIVGNLRTGCAHAGDERALADRWHANKGSVCHELHLELDPVILRRLALLGKGRRAPDGCHEVDVATASDAARGYDDALAGMREVCNLVERLLRLMVELAHDGAERHLEDQVLAVLAVLSRSLAMRAALCLEVMLVAVVDERRELGVRLEDDISSASAISAVRPAFRHIGLAPE